MELGRFQGSSWMLIWIKLRPRIVPSSFCLNSGAGEWDEGGKGTEAALENGGTKAYVPSPDFKAQNPRSRMPAGLGYYLVHGGQKHGKCATDS